MEVDVEEGAGFGSVFDEDAAFFGEALVERGAGKGGEVGHLDIVESALFDEVEDVAEALGAIAIHAEDEAAVHGDPVLLNGFDRAQILIGAAGLPIGFLFNSVHGCEGGAFEADEDLLAAGVAHHFDEIFIVRDGEVGFGEPSYLLFGEGFHERFAVALVGKGIVVGELDERTLVKFFEKADFGNDALDGFDAELGGESHGSRAEFAGKRATSLALHGEARIAVGVEEFESWDGGFGEVEGANCLGVVGWLELIGEKVGHHLRPDDFAFADGKAVDVLLRFERIEGGVQSAKDDGGANLSESGSETVGFLGGGGERGKRDGIEVSREVVLIDIADFEVFDLDFIGRHSGEGEKTERGEGFDFLGASAQAGEAESFGEDLGVTNPESADGNESDFHGLA